MTTNISALYGIDRNRSSGRWKSQTFTASGVWSRPAGVEVVKVLLVGGGGSGAVSRYVNGNNGGDSSFGNILIAEGGKRGLNFNFNKYNDNPETSGIPGGIGTGFPTAYTYRTNIYSNPEFNPFEATSALLFNTKNTIPDGILGISSAFGSTGGGGGTLATSSNGYAYGNGGNVIGFGNGGAGPCGGGASYGNGGAGGSTAGSTGGFGGGGGGAAAGGGGGGGEIVLREVPITSDIAIIIGAGGSSVTRTINGIYHVSGAGGNGLCIVYWQE